MTPSTSLGSLSNIYRHIHRTHTAFNVCCALLDGHYPLTCKRYEIARVVVDAVYYVFDLKLRFRHFQIQVCFVLCYIHCSVCWHETPTSGRLTQGPCVLSSRFPSLQHMSWTERDKYFMQAALHEV